MKKKFLFLSLVLVMIFISACANTNNNNKNNNLNNKSPAEPEQSADNTSQRFKCDEFKNPNFCLISNALVEDNKEKCNYLLEYSNLCRNYFGIKDNNYSVCEPLDKANQLSCYLGIMFNKLDFEECYKHPFAFYTLSAIYGGAPEPKSKEDIISSCNYLILSQNRHKKEICSSVPEGVLEEDWNSYCNKTLSQLSILSVPEKEMCEETNSKDVCYLEYATANLDLEACNKVNNTLLKDSCMYEIAVNTNNLDLCPKSERHPACVSRIIGMKK